MTQEDEDRKIILSIVVVLGIGLVVMSAVAALFGFHWGLLASFITGVCFIGIGLAWV